MKHKRFLSVLLALVFVLTLLPAVGAPAKAVSMISIDQYTFPDGNFRDIVLESCDIDHDNKLSAEEIADVIALDIEDEFISDLTGLEYFTALEVLDCSDNKLTSLDLSHNTKLKRVNCSNNKLPSLNIEGCTELEELSCAENRLTGILSLPTNLTALYYLNVKNNPSLQELWVSLCPLKTLIVEGCTALYWLTVNNCELKSVDLSSCTALQYLTLSGNGLTELDVSNCPKLHFICCENNELTEVDLSQNTELAQISLFDNRLTELDVGWHDKLRELDIHDNPSLDTLYCYNCILTSLDVTGCTTLKELDCSGNQLTSLDVTGCTALEMLYCSSNQLTSLNLSGCTALQKLDSYNNKLTALDVSGCTALTNLICQNNELTELDVSGCTALDSLSCNNNQLTALNLKQNKNLERVYCYDNRLTSLSVSGCTALEELNCLNNQLASLDLSGCAALKWLICTQNSISRLNISSCPVLLEAYQGEREDYESEGTECTTYTANQGRITVNRTTEIITVPKPVISSVKANKTSANAGEKITWTCTASGGSGDLQYYFILYKDGTKIKTRSYSSTKTYSYTPTEAGTYKVKVYVKDAAGNKVNKTSKGVTVTAVAAPVITTQPKAQTAAAGATATFKVVASGTGLTYQWQYSKDGTNWTNKTGATSASYTVTAKASYNGLYYRCKVSNAGGSVYSNKAKLTVTSAVSKPEITTQPKAQTAAAGETATFKVVASGTGLTYQWQYSTDYGKTWHDKAGSTKATHTVTVKASYNGYLYRCKVTNSAGTVTSSKVRLTVSGVKPKILSQPAAKTAAAGESVTFKVVAAGVGMTYQWQYKTAGSSTWKNKTGATSASYTVTAKESYNGIQYRCVVKNSIGSVTSDPAVLTVK